MKTKLQITIYLILFGFVFLNAQKGVEDGSQYGKGQDSVRCVQNLSLFYTYAQTQNYKDAKDFWEIVFNECPASSRNVYIYGVKICIWQIEQENDPLKRSALINKLLSIYDKRIKYFGDDPRYPTPWIIGRKAFDYLTYSRSDTTNATAYKWLSQSVSELKEYSEPNVIFVWVGLSEFLMKKDSSHQIQYINDYQNAVKYLDKIAIADTINKEVILKMKSDITTAFTQSGAADCNTMQAIYGPKVEKNKNDIKFLREAMSMMRRVDCQQIEAYFDAAMYAHKIQPTFESAIGYARMAIKKNNNNEAIRYFEQAASLTNNSKEKAEQYYNISVLLAEIRSYPKARSYALKAISYNNNYGAPYILIAQMYAADAHNIEKDPIMSKTIFYAAVDKLEKAKAVDPSVTSEANKLIAIYRTYFPSSEEIFMHPALTKGNTITIGGWIGEKTIVR